MGHLIETRVRVNRRAQDRALLAGSVAAPVCSAPLARLAADLFDADFLAADFLAADFLAAAFLADVVFAPARLAPPRAAPAVLGVPFAAALVPSASAGDDEPSTARSPASWNCTQSSSTWSRGSSSRSQMFTQRSSMTMSRRATRRLTAPDTSNSASTRSAT